MLKQIHAFFDHLKYKVRNRLSARPILYASLAGVGTVLLWRSIWLTADDFSISGPISIAIGALILLLTVIFVSRFIGNRVLLIGTCMLLA